MNFECFPLLWVVGPCISKSVMMLVMTICNYITLVRKYMNAENFVKLIIQNFVSF